MNLTQLTTFVALSACAITENPIVATANVIPTPESVAEIQIPNSIIQLENATIQSIAQPETLSQTPEVLTSATVITTNVAPVESIATPIEPAVELAMSDRDGVRVAESRIADSRVADSRIADSRASYRPITPRIEVGTQGIPPITDLPDRISLPPESLLPANFQNPIVLGQAMDSRITTASPITDRMVDPVWSRRMEDLKAYKDAYSESLIAWSERVTQCMNEKPKLYVLQPNGKKPPIQLPMYFDGKEGTIVQNKDGVSVCGM